MQVPRRTTTKNFDKSGVLSGRGLHASSTTVVSVEVAKIGRLPVMLRGKVAKYVMGLCWTPPTVAFCSGMTVLYGSVKIYLTKKNVNV